MTSNRFALNILKTELIIFDNKINDTDNVSLSLDGHEAETSDHAKFLGITIDRKLIWKEHISVVSSGVSRSNGIINRLKDTLPKYVLLLFYNVLILPQINYSLLL